ncbi:MAG TPA: outer membrane beta-barrel domain-containing protein, partial [Gammaproteobacteria bacterium]|nr:outer membrane beta-barrel domain-containing protein [Gammaproteobacteria bacterium]
LYIIAGAGNTEFADDSHFTVNAGAGYRFLLNDWIALHLDFRDHIFDSDLLGNDKTTHNLEGTGGVTIFF